jgi:hypothetical protein
MVILLPANNTAAAIKTAEMEATKSFLFTGGGHVNNLITGLTAGGFEVGSGSNANLVQYHYLAWSPVEGITASGSFVGNGQNNRIINEPGFQPDFVLLRRNASVPAVMRSASTSAGLSFFGSAIAHANSHVTDLFQDGFVVGNNSRVNANGSETFWSAFRSAPATPQTTTALAVSKTLCRNGDLVTLTMNLTSDMELSNIVPDAPTVNASGSASAELVSGPSPSSANISAGGGSSFSWTYRVEAGQGSGEIRFIAGAVAGDYVFGSATSPSLNVSLTGSGQSVTWNLGSAAGGAGGAGESQILTVMQHKRMTPKKRIEAAKFILSVEARVDKAGRLAVYRLPAADGGGTYEVAGINDRYHPTAAALLRGMIGRGEYREAELYIVEYLARYTDVVDKWTCCAVANVFLRDCCFNRGPKGALRICQIAVEVADDGRWGPVTRAALRKLELTPDVLLRKLRAAREAYERRVAPPVGARAKFWVGLVRRWDKAAEFAGRYLG